MHRAPPAHRRAVVALCAAFALLGAWWSMLAPLGEAPDERSHHSLVLHLADGNGYPAFDGLMHQRGAIRVCETYAASARFCPRPEEERWDPTRLRTFPRDDAPPRAERPTWSEDGGIDDAELINQMPQHPPLYYQGMASALQVARAATGGAPLAADRELALLRLLNVALVAPLPALAWWGARRFGLPDDIALTAAIFPFVLPMLSHIGATLNNDNLLVLSGAVVAALLAGVVRGDRSARTALLLGVAAAVGLLTKAFAIVFLPAIGLAYVVGTTGADESGTRWSVSRAGRSMVAPLAIAAGSTVALAGWWFVGVRLRTGSFAPTTESERLNSSLRPPGFEADPVAYAENFVRLLSTRTWGSFGWFSVQVPDGQAGLCTIGLLIALGAGLAPHRCPAGSSRLQRAALLTPLVLLGAFVAGRAWSIYASTSTPAFIQGRYLFGAVTATGLIAAIGLHRAFGRRAPVVLGGLAIVLQGDAIRRCLHGYWSGPGLGPIDEVLAAAAWSAWPPGVLVALAAVTSVGAIATPWLVREAIRPAPRAADA